MHEQSPPIAHRDIKIENILRKGNLFKLCDFGSCSTDVIVLEDYPAQMFYKLEELFEKNITPMYRPPEMADLYRRKTISTKVDIWMLGCVAYTMCFFKHPFLEGSKLAIAEANYNFPTDKHP